MGLLLLAAALLYFLKIEMTIARARTSDTDLSAGKEKMKAASITEVRAIDVGLDDFALDLDKRAPWGKKLPRKTILKPVSATFQAGVAERDHGAIRERQDVAAQLNGAEAA